MTPEQKVAAALKAAAQEHLAALGITDCKVQSVAPAIVFEVEELSDGSIRLVQKEE